MQTITKALLAQLVARAEASPRRRTNHNFHANLEANPHRFLNVMLEGTYVQPHRHLDPPKDESFVILQGRAGILTFDDEGRVTEAVLLGPGEECDALGSDVAAGTWHTVVALSPVVVCFEVKPGPYLQTNDKDFATWAPAEGEAGVAEYQGQLAARFAGR